MRAESTDSLPAERNSVTFALRRESSLVVLRIDIRLDNIPTLVLDLGGLSVARSVSPRSETPIVIFN